MKIGSANFFVSNTDYKKCPKASLPEYAFIGRSNVGKSSLINALCNNNNLAKTSGKPGKTQLINHFIIDNSWYLVDLPGIGYAKVSKSKRLEFKKMIENYLINRRNLMCLFMLIDSRHRIQKIDEDFMQWLAIEEIPFVIVFTKKDKLNQNVLNQNIKQYKEYLLNTWNKLPDIFITSAEKKDGLEEIKKFISNLNSQF